MKDVTVILYVYGCIYVHMLFICLGTCIYTYIVYMYVYVYVYVCACIYTHTYKQYMYNLKIFF